MDMLEQWVVAEGQGDEEEIVLRSLHNREAGLFCDHWVVKIHRRDRIGSEASFFLHFFLFLASPVFPSTSSYIFPFSCCPVFLLFMLSSSFKKYVCPSIFLRVLFPSSFGFLSPSFCSSFVNYFSYSRMLWARRG